jgi:hypothetical protein
VQTWTVLFASKHVCVFISSKPHPEQLLSLALSYIFYIIYALCGTNVDMEHQSCPSVKEKRQGFL